MARREKPKESVYNLIPGGKPEKPEKTPMYMSKYRGQVKQEKQQNKAAHKTMGVAKVPISPDKYLLKHSKEPKLPEKKPFLYKDVQLRKPPIPVPSKQPPVDTHTQKDFITSNAVRNIKAVPRKPEPAYADTRHGRKELLENSGLVPKYTKKKDFGDVPVYLRQKRAAERKAQEEYDRYIKEKMEQEAMEQLSEDERQDILQGLKTNFNELLNEYRGMSLVIDMISKRQKRLRLEEELNQLEKDIKLMEKFKVIYIADDWSQHTS